MTTTSTVTERLYDALPEAGIAFPAPVETVRLVPPEVHPTEADSMAEPSPATPGNGTSGTMHATERRSGAVSGRAGERSSDGDGSARTSDLG